MKHAMHGTDDEECEQAAGQSAPDEDRRARTPPLIQLGPCTRPVRTRIVAALVLAGCLVVLGLAVWLKPDPRGLGTHEQLGFGPCGFLVLTGYPCPTCGMTTAFCHAVRGHWWRAVVAQPMGFLLALATVVVTVAAGIVLVTGRPWLVDWWRVDLFRIGIGLFVLFFGSWGLKVLIGRLNGSLPMRP